MRVAAAIAALFGIIVAWAHGPLRACQRSIPNAVSTIIMLTEPIVIVDCGYKDGRSAII